MTPCERIKRAPQAIKRRGLDLLYSLIQPRRIPERPQGLPRIRVEILITVLGLIGWGIFLRYYDQVSPTASLDLRYDRAQIARLAEDYVQERGFDLQGYHRVVTFEDG